MNKLILQQRLYLQQLESSRTNFKKDGKGRKTSTYIERRESNLHDLVNKFQRNHERILELLEGKEEELEMEYFKEQIYIQLEDIYLQYLAEIDDVRSTYTPITEHSSKATSNADEITVDREEMKLPRISVPKFNGRYEDWIPFRDLFKSLIHNRRGLSNVEKIHYLKCSLEGEAANLLKHLTIADSNYEVAWKVVCDRYDNEQALLNAHFRKLFALSAANESATSLKFLLDRTLEATQSIEAMEIWEQEISSKSELPTLDHLKTFIENRFRALEAVGAERSKQKPTSINRGVHTYQASNLISCTMCKEKHVLRLCPTFLSMDHASKLNFAKQRALCLNCQRVGHVASNCPSSGICFKCKRNHHTTLHKTDVPFPTSRDTQNQVEVHSINALTRREVLLATALVTVDSPNGNITLRALVDQGSQATLITESAFQRLGVERINSNICISGIDRSSPKSVNGSMKAKLLTLDNTKIFFNALILDKLTNLVPSKQIHTHIKEETNTIRLADPHFDKPGKIDLLLGADVYSNIIIGDVLELPSGPIAQNTRLGWIITGEAGTSNENTYRSFNVEVSETDVLSSQLKKFWELEEIPFEKSYNEEDSRCERHFVETTERQPNGRFKVRLPFKGDELKASLGKSRHIAEASYTALQRRFYRDPNLKHEYTKCLEGYIASGYMFPVEYPTCSSHQNSNYLPHHAVCKESSTTKVRVVFDASRKTASGISLNDTLLTGPAIQNSLIDVLMRLRLYKYAYIADVAKMYLQIDMHEDDSFFQMILWQSDPGKGLQQYRLATVTFGTTCAPFLAIRTLHMLAENERLKYPLGSQSVLNDFYVDDLLSGDSDLEQALKKRNETIALLESGGFKLRKWLSNDRRLLADLHPDDIEMSSAIDLNLDQGFKSLGIQWHPVNDYFTYRLRLKDRDTQPTKRTILSDAASLFDPLGWISPITIIAKIMLKNLWRHGCDWDAPIPNKMITEWTDYRHSLKRIENIRIPRWIRTAETSQLQLHGFADASKAAYAAAVYIVVRNNDKISSHLIASKTKVTPTIEVTIPKLELCAAVLVSKLMKLVKDAHNFTQVDTYLWTDNTTVICWLKGDPTRWTDFVANRTRTIFSIVGKNPWLYVPSAENPADIASRGMKPKDLVNSTLWWNGPEWIVQDRSQWPGLVTDTDTDVELKKKRNLQCFHIQYSVLDELLMKFSSLTKLIRVTAYCLRFKLKKHKGNIPKTEYLSTVELKDAFELWIKYTQSKFFSSEIRNIRNKIDLDSKSKILSLNPQLGEDDILRVGGRLKNANLPVNERHPIILPKQGKFTELYLERVHKATLHGQTQLMLATIRKKMWLIDGRNTIRRFIHKCVSCFKAKATTSTQLMGNLPTPRVTISRPFTHTGVDYCGPFHIRDRIGRGRKICKVYVAVFICLAVKAVHIELVSDMSTAAFLAAFRRFVGRRGLSSHVYSDCGTNFVGADKELKEIVKINRELIDQVTSEGITWHFNPPASPHFGGLWEAGVKSVKLHLRRVLANALLTFEELNTTLIQIESCLNSRPLCPLSDDPTDDVALTPAHFLIGDSLLAPPQVDVTEINMNRLDRWQLTQRLSQMFWKQWTNEYLRRLQQRPKWLHKRANPKPGDLCLIKEDKIPSFKWPLARIIEVHPGDDSLVRVVTVRMKGNIYKRPITKVALLPTQIN